MPGINQVNCVGAPPCMNQQPSSTVFDRLHLQSPSETNLSWRYVDLCIKPRKSFMYFAL